MKFIDILLQDMEICSPKGRDCFEKHSSQTFNCSATCEGVYASVLWEEDTIMKEEEILKEMESLDNKLKMELMDLEWKMKLMKGNNKNMAEEMDKEKLKELISEYKKFKMENVRHFRFHPNATHFGKSSLSSFSQATNCYKNK